MDTPTEDKTLEQKIYDRCQETKSVRAYAIEQEGHIDVRRILPSPHKTLLRPGESIIRVLVTPIQK